MKKASFGRRSSAAGRNTFGTFGRQNSFDGNDIKYSLISILSSYCLNIINISLSCLNSQNSFIYLYP